MDALYIRMYPDSPRAASKGGSQVTVGDHMVVDVDEEGVPVGIDIYHNASRLVDLSRIEAEGPVFGLRPADGAERSVG